ncbi:hypothetical protein CTI12_AA306040 [Artemisia annua]|uniref:Uncharacterized protein n=1 Tax=Artemisia annua TaxID=35608 RepID=A0A2U1N5B3_ARTAN|nr:hypothetical protein CTI12_AA306040 [Artemisia annua]
MGGTKHQQSNDTVSDPKKRRKVGFTQPDEGVQPNDVIKIFIAWSKSVSVFVKKTCLVKLNDVIKIFNGDSVWMKLFLSARSKFVTVTVGIVVYLVFDLIRGCLGMHIVLLKVKKAYRSVWIAMSLCNNHIVSKEEEVGSPECLPIEPVDLSCFFEEDGKEDGKIYGYQGLKITVWISSISFKAFADISFESTSDAGKGVTDLKTSLQVIIQYTSFVCWLLFVCSRAMLMTISLSSLQNIFADNLVETKDDFLKTFSTDNQYIKSMISDGKILQPSVNSQGLKDSKADELEVRITLIFYMKDWYHLFFSLLMVTFSCSRLLNKYGNVRSRTGYSGHDPAMSGQDPVISGYSGHDPVTTRLDPVIPAMTRLCPVKTRLYPVIPAENRLDPGLAVLLSSTIPENGKRLRRLSVNSCRDLMYLKTGPEDGKNWLPSLEVLSMYRLPSLTVVWKNPIMKGSLQNLRSVSIWYCDKLKNISWILQLPKLETVYLFYCKEIVEVISGDEQIHEEAFPCLRTISLRDLPLLTSISQTAINFPCMQSIAVIDCPKLTKLPLKVAGNSSQPAVYGNIEWWNRLEWDTAETTSSFRPHFMAT